MLDRRDDDDSAFSATGYAFIYSNSSTDAAVVNQVACQVFGVFSLKTRMKIIWSLMLATYLDLHQPSWCVCVQCAVCSVLDTGMCEFVCISLEFVCTRKLK